MKMETHQALHVGMINSYNVIIGNATYDEVLNANIGIFAHDPNEYNADVLKTLIAYFQEVEMYEHCAELMRLYEQDYNPDGTLKDELCNCDMPLIEKYTRKVMCGSCGKRIIR